jgi:hypothetical protein
MKKLRLCWIAPLACVACLAILACDEEPKSKSRPTFAADGGADAGLDATSRGPAYAVISSDFSATSVSLLAADGDIVADDYLNSGSTESGLVTALSGDVEMPTRSGERGVMVLLDRFKTDVVTRVELSSGDILGQVQVHGTADEDAFTANPQDYLRIDATTAWVVRGEPNLDPDAAESDRGNDLLRIDPSEMKRTDDRIDLSALNGRATRVDPMTGAEEEVDVYARPGRLARIGDTLIVGLGRSAFDFSAVGSGMVAVVNLKNKAVSGLPIDDLRGCSHVEPIPGATDRVLVGCGGMYPTPRDNAGVAIVRVSNGKASVTRSWRASEHADAPAISEGYVAIDANTVGGSLNGFVAGDADSVFGILDLESGELTTVLSTPAGGTFGTPLYDADSGRLFVPDSSVDGDLRPTAGVRVLERGDGGVFEQTNILEVAKDTGLPARHVFRL